MKRKWLAVGIILLFMEVGVIPSISAIEVNAITYDSNQNILANWTTFYVGLIKDLNQSAPNKYYWVSVIGFVIGWIDGELYNIEIIPTGAYCFFPFDTMNGIVTKHFACAVFCIQG